MASSSVSSRCSAIKSIRSRISLFNSSLLEGIRGKRKRLFSLSYMIRAVSKPRISGERRYSSNRSNVQWMDLNRLMIWESDIFLSAK